MNGLRQAITIALAALAVNAALPAVAQTRGPAECAAPVDVYRDEARLRATAAKLQAKQPLKVVVIGGAASLGTAAGAPQLSYPAQLQAILQERFPASPISVLNKSVPRQTAKDQYRRFHADAIAEKPDLVIWDTGAYDAVRSVDLDEFIGTVQNGIEKMRDKKIDLMVMDLQYGKVMQAMLDMERYRDALTWLTDVNETYFFRRYALMKYWKDASVFDYTNPPGKDYQQLAVRVYECLAYRMADAIAVAAVLTTAGNATN